MASKTCLRIAPGTYALDVDKPLALGNGTLALVADYATYADSPSVTLQGNADSANTTGGVLHILDSGDVRPPLPNSPTTAHHRPIHRLAPCVRHRPLPCLQVYLYGLTIADGLAERGGGIFNEGHLSMSSCRVRDSADLLATSSEANPESGGVYSTGTIHMETCTVQRSGAETSIGRLHLEHAAHPVVFPVSD